MDKFTLTAYPCWPPFITLALSFTDPAMDCQHLWIVLVRHRFSFTSVGQTEVVISSTNDNRHQNQYICRPWVCSVSFISLSHKCISPNLTDNILPHHGFSCSTWNCTPLLLNCKDLNWNLRIQDLCTRTWIGTSGTRGQNPCWPYAPNVVGMHRHRHFS